MSDNSSCAAKAGHIRPPTDGVRVPASLDHDIRPADSLDAEIGKDGLDPEDVNPLAPPIDVQAGS
jgi:hypothetical protein